MLQNSIFLYWIWLKISNEKPEDLFKSPWTSEDQKIIGDDSVLI